MIEISQPLALLVSLIIGAVVGFERESHAVDMKGNEELHHSVGVRTFALTGLLGGIAGILYSSHLLTSVMITAVVAVIAVAYYVVYSLSTKDLGFTTELSFLLTYILAFCVGAQAIPIQIILAITVVTVLILSQKQYIRTIALDIERSEMQAFISYGLIAVVILPFLPDTSYAISDIQGVSSLFDGASENAIKIANAELFNPFRLWFVVALITGIDVFGYILEKIIGEKHGRLLTSVVGGFISSTATTQALAQESKKRSKVSRLVAAALFANAVSFLPITLLIVTINSAFLLQALPAILLLFITSAALGFYFLKKSTAKETEQNDSQPGKKHTIFSIGPALKFALFFIFVKSLAQLALALFGEIGFLASAAVAGFSGIDAMTITISQLAGVSIDVSLALKAFLLLNAVNLIAKCIYSYIQGSIEFAKPFAISMTVIIASSLLSLVFV